MYIEPKMNAATETAAPAPARSNNFIDFFDLETGERIHAYDLGRPVGSLWNILGHWQHRQLLEDLVAATGILVDRDSLGWLMIGTGEGNGSETTQVSEHVFDYSGTLHLTGAHLYKREDGTSVCDYATRNPARERAVRFVKRSDYSR